MKEILKNKKFLQKDKEYFGTSIPRCWWKKKKGKMSQRVLVKCGDCDNTIEIYYDKEKSNNKIEQAINDQVEIGGVLATKKWWKELFKEIGIIE